MGTMLYANENENALAELAEKFGVGSFYTSL